jgi:hypothetical protein
MTQENQKGPTEASNCVASTPQPIPCPPDIEPQLLLKWGLALLGKERATEYLAWVRERLGADSR